MVFKWFVNAIPAKLKLNTSIFSLSAVIDESFTNEDKIAEYIDQFQFGLDRYSVVVITKEPP